MIRRAITLDLYYPATEVPVHAEVSVYPWTTKRSRKKKAEALKGTWLKYKNGCTRAYLDDGRVYTYYYWDAQLPQSQEALPSDIEKSVLR